MANKISVLIDVTVDKAVNSLKNFRKSIADADGITNKFKAGSKSAFDGVKANAGAMAIGAAGSIVAFSGAILEAGAEMEAMDAKANTVFGKSLGRVTKWAETNAAAMGLTSREAITAGANIADLLKPMGFTEEAATDNSLALLELSGALSAWSGGQRSAAEVSQIFTKAMLGEREELKSLGISISEADVQTRLLEKSQNKLTGTALQQAKAVATQELIYEKSTDAQKAWADGSMDGIKSQNEARAATARLAEVMNESLYPVLVDLVPLIAETTESLIPLAESLSSVSDVVDSKYGDLGRKFLDVATGVDALKNTIGLFKDETISASDAQVVANELWGEAAATVDAVTTALDVATSSTDDLGDGLGRVDRSAKDFTDEVKRAEAQLQDAKDAVQAMDLALDKLKGNVDKREAWRNMHDAIGELMVKMADGESSWDDLAAASDGATLAVADYIEAADNIPPEIKTQLYTELDAGNLDIVRQYLADIAEGVDVPVRLKLPAGLSSNSSGQVVGWGGQIIAGATGGIVTKPTMALIGEAGPEAVIPLNQAPGASPLPGGMGGGGGLVVNNYGANPNAVIAAIKQYERMNGTGWRR